MKNILTVIFFSLMFFTSNAQDNNSSSPLDHYLGEWETYSKGTVDKPSKLIYRWKAEKFTAGYGIQFTFFRVRNDGSENPAVTMNWVYHPESGMVYNCVTTANGSVTISEGPIESNGSVKLRSRDIGAADDEYGIYTWTFKSNNQIVTQSISYKDEQQVSSFETMSKKLK